MRHELDEGQRCMDPKYMVGTISWTREQMKILGHVCVNGIVRDACPACVAGK